MWLKSGKERRNAKPKEGAYLDTGVEVVTFL
jgi:hypothetical protein